MSCDEALLWEKLGNSRRTPLEPEWLGEIYSPSLSVELKQTIAERLGWLAERGWPVIQSLINQFGSEPELIHASGLCHQVEAKDWLIAQLQGSEALPLDVIQALACWGAVIPGPLLRNVLTDPSQTMRLAGLELLSFKAHQLSDEQLLDLTEELLKDWRDPIALAAIRLLQRRDGEPICKRLAQIASDAHDAISAAAIRALGCIATPESQAALTKLGDNLPAGLSRELVNKQLNQQYRSLA